MRRVSDTEAAILSLPFTCIARRAPPERKPMDHEKLYHYTFNTKSSRVCLRSEALLALTIVKPNLMVARAAPVNLAVPGLQSKGRLQIERDFDGGALFVIAGESPLPLVRCGLAWTTDGEREVAEAMLCQLPTERFLPGCYVQHIGTPPTYDDAELCVVWALLASG